MIKAVIFDLDGVLVDSEPLWERSTWAYLRAKCGPGARHRLDEKKLNREVRGRTQLYISRYLKNQLNLPDPLSTIVRDRLRIVQKLFARHLKLSPGALPLLRLLQKRGYPMILASSGPRLTVNYVLRRFKLKKFFRATISGDDMKYSKPHPWVFIRAAKILKQRPANVLVIEDSISGTQAAIRAGTKLIALKKSYTPKKYLKQAVAVVNNLKQISINTIYKI